MFRVFGKCIYSTLIVAGAFCAQLGYAAQYQNDLGLQSPSELKTIVGQALFERRYTRVIEQQCSSEPCARSQAYWSLVLESQGTRYLLNEKLALGAKRAPESIQLAGVTLRPGAYMRVEARTIEGGNDFYILQDVRNIRLLMDFGWSCHSEAQEGPNYLVRVWYEGRDSIHGSYKIRVEQVSGRAVYPVAFVNRAQFSTLSDQYVFKGQSAHQQVELGIEQIADQYMNLPASMILSGDAAESVIEMKCSRTRLSTHFFE